jgi:hypothetical protein
LPLAKKAKASLFIFKANQKIPKEGFTQNFKAPPFVVW